MKELIDKAAVIAEIERRISNHNKELQHASDEDFVSSWASDEENQKLALTALIPFLDTLEVKEVKEKFERPNIKIKDAIEVSSRMKYIDEDLKPIADFIMDYASWNLHKDEWNQPVLEVPVFRVLDALAQKGKPYCCV